jgi:hypothetical protein
VDGCAATDDALDHGGAVASRVSVTAKIETNPLTPNMTTKAKTKAANGARILKGDGREGSISFVARQLIRSGKTNEAVFKALVKRFGPKRIPESHKHYPSWYRRQLVVAGPRREQDDQRLSAPGCREARISRTTTRLMVVSPSGCLVFTRRASSEP